MQMRPEFLRCQLLRMFLALFLFACLFSEASTARENDPPNVILFFIDDLGYKDLGCYGSTFYQTPRLDDLAKNGIRFLNFYSANPVCSPTRAALMTGKAPQRLGITQWINQKSTKHLSVNECTMGQAFADAGYHTGYIGKWHLGHQPDHMPNRKGFHETIGVNRAGQPGSYFFPYRRRRRQNQSSESSPWDVPDFKDGSQGDYLTDKLTDKAIAFISKNKKRPFFLCFGHYAVHTPIQAPEKLVKKYQEKAKRLTKKDSPLTRKERNGASSRLIQNHPTYAAMIENLDNNIGRVLDHLAKLQLTDNTIVVFTSDNGGLSTLNGKRVGPTSCVPLRAGKGWTYEGGIRIPTIVSWPKKFRPATSETLGITMDLYPTLLELAGIPLKPKQHLDGRSLVTALKNKPNKELQQRFLAWTYPHRHGSGHSPSNAIRRGDWKLVQLTDSKTADDKRIELYNLKSDIGESKNVAQKHPKKTSELKKLLTQWLAETKEAKNE